MGPGNPRALFYKSVFLKLFDIQLKDNKRITIFIYLNALKTNL